jgi:hypothetical protein
MHPSPIEALPQIPLGELTAMPQTALGELTAMPQTPAKTGLNFSYVVASIVYKVMKLLAVGNGLNYNMHKLK